MTDPAEGTRWAHERRPPALPSPSLPPLPTPEPAEGLGRFPLSRWFGLAGGLLLVVLVIGLVFAVRALEESRLSSENVVNVIDPVALHTLELKIALNLQDSSVREFAKTSQTRHRADYYEAIQSQRVAEEKIDALLGRMPEGEQYRTELARLTAAADVWQREYAEVVIRAVPQAGSGALTETLADHGINRFNELRGTLTPLQMRLTRLHEAAGAAATGNANAFYTTLAILLICVLSALALIAVVVRYFVLRPLDDLAQQVRAVASGDFEHELKVDRPAEFAELSGHIDSMRGRILLQWRKAVEAQVRLEEQTEELRRSNGELEQFAYVASHDLQEPLRKVASFTQMLEQRYGEQLDDRAKQYIMYAVDGAKRMQALINDLLDFSRVGRVGSERKPTDSGAALSAALRNLAAPIEDAGATVTHDEMPEVYGNPLLLTQLFQNLVGNAVKFRSEAPPVVRIGVRPDGDMWEFCCADNGIGVDAKYADKIFFIFQRLHARDVYPGTGIGLALAKKIVEYHGGRIWLDDRDNANGSGTTFRWTLPAVTSAMARFDTPAAEKSASGAKDG